MALGDKWVCIGDRYDDGVMHANLKGHGNWVVTKRATEGKGIRNNNCFLNEPW